MTVLRNARLVLPDGVQKGDLPIQGGRIAASNTPGVDEIDLGGRYVVPGFVDMHVHGGAGASYQGGREEDARRAAEFHLAAGTTTTIASLVTGDPRELADAVAALADLAAGGLLAAALNDPRVTVELVNDGVHIEPGVVRLAFEAAGAGRVALITDAMAAAGMGDGDYRLGVMAVHVRDGRATLAGGSSLAGSTITMADGFRSAVTEVGLPIERATEAAALTPARALGIDSRVGSLEPGKDADLLVLDDDLTVARVMKGGRWL